MAKSLDVARNLIHLAAAEEEPENLTHMRLQKLLYYVQGWSLALRGKPMFNGRIEAWAHGPVVRELYSHFTQYGENPIQVNEIPDSEELDTDEVEFIQSVWESYKPYSASSLRAMTHKEPPWVDARGSCAPADRCDTEITHDAMRRYFSSQAIGS